jgi:peroxiredoxin
MTHERRPLLAVTLVLLVATAVALAGWYAFAPRLVAPAADDIAQEAQAYLREKKPEPLAGPLPALLAEPKKPLVPSEPHALLNQFAPGFTLPDVDGKPTDLDDLLSRGPVVVVFYLGYQCNHCVSQLFDLNEDLAYFRELGATVVAVSPDKSEHTRERYKKYGAFGFPVLSDADHAVARRYGVSRPAVGELKAWEAHGTFVIGRDRYVHWAKTGDEPFTGNDTLLAELARLEGKTPKAK